MKVLIIVSLFLMVLPSAHAEISLDVRQAVEKIMSVYYSSSYDKLRGCTLYDDGSETYCLAPKHYEFKNIEGVDTLYVLVSGDTVEDGARVTPGFGGLFILYKLGNSWVVSASEPYIRNGGAGRSQLIGFDLREVGADRYGWVGKFCGSGAGGQTNCSWSMYAAMTSGKVEEVARLNLDYSYELMSKSSYGEAESDVSINTGGVMTQGFYPLKVTVDYEHGLYDNNYEPIPSSLDKGTDSFIVEFNEQTQTFNLPDDKS